MATSPMSMSRANLFDEAAAHCVVLDANGDIEVRAIHLAIFRENVANATGNFAT